MPKVSALSRSAGPLWLSCWLKICLSKEKYFYNMELPPPLKLDSPLISRLLLDPCWIPVVNVVVSWVYHWSRVIHHWVLHQGPFLLIVHPILLVGIIVIKRVLRIELQVVNCKTNEFLINKIVLLMVSPGSSVHIENTLASQNLQPLQ